MAANRGARCPQGPAIAGRVPNPKLTRGQRLASIPLRVPYSESLPRSSAPRRGVPRPCRTAAAVEPLPMALRTIPTAGPWTPARTMPARPDRAAHAASRHGTDQAQGPMPGPEQHEPTPRQVAHQHPRTAIKSGLGQYRERPVSEPKCAICGAAFFPVSEAWGDDTCGDCIAASIELSLMPMSFRGQRKPVRRAPTPDEQQERVAEPHRRAG